MPAGLVTAATIERIAQEAAPMPNKDAHLYVMSELARLRCAPKSAERHRLAIWEARRRIHERDPGLAQRVKRESRQARAAMKAAAGLVVAKPERPRPEPAFPTVLPTSLMATRPVAAPHPQEPESLPAEEQQTWNIEGFAA